MLQIDRDQKSNTSLYVILEGKELSCLQQKMDKQSWEGLEQKRSMET